VVVADGKTVAEHTCSLVGDLAIDVDRQLFGDSVAKHPYVDGLSDVDALVVVDAPSVCRASSSNISVLRSRACWAPAMS